MKTIVIILLLSMALTPVLQAQHKSYFPTTKDNSGIDASKISWYSGILKKMHEPVLFNYKTSNEIYRFTWIRSFDAPVVIRLENHKGSYVIYWKEEINGNAIEKQKPVSKTNWDLFQYRLKQIGFWKLSTNEDTPQGADGAEWVLEGRLPNQYHVTDRWTPREKTDYYKCCDLLISLTDLKIPEHRKY